MLEKTTIEMLKQADPDRCRAAMFGDPDIRDALLTLYAFHYELAKIPELVSEPMVGAMRYQWWRDCVDEIYLGKPVRRHEVATPLAKVLIDYNVPRFWIDNLIDGRERDIDPRAFSDLQACQDYSRQTSGQLAEIAAKICEAESDYPSQDLGTAWGLTGLLRGWVFYQHSILKEISPEAIWQAANVSYSAVQQSDMKVPASLMPALAYCALIPGFQKRHNPGLKTDTAPSYSALRKRGRLLITAMTGKLPQ